MAKILSIIWQTVSAYQLKHSPIHHLRPDRTTYKRDIWLSASLQRIVEIEKWLDEWSLIEEDIGDANFAGSFNFKSDFINANLPFNPRYAHVLGLMDGRVGVKRGFR
ncbi:hypothetical protein ACJ72_06934 [Emergomyces africanus]|uniref:Uncharacterized protein n=1 Tax=Emergomyces africanus TaxID=1955775 RepID=A0A1B7NQ57_9EURO|nr:hypothetical protein ACJ72_06934 [Emergomyces africanus]